MGNRERVRQLKVLRGTALGIGTRKLKLRLKKIAATEVLALAAYLALLIEDANINAKRWGPGYSDHYYRAKQQMIRELILLFKHQEWTYGVHESDRRETAQIIYFEIPGCAQISWHYTHEGPPLPRYEQPWDGQTNSTLPKLLAFIQQEFPEIALGG
jgi:hypothetical protein